MGELSKRLTTGAMGIGIFLLGLFGEALVPTSYSSILAGVGVALVGFAVLWPYFMGWQFGKAHIESSNDDRPPIALMALTMETPIFAGANVSGILWEEEFSYVQLTVRNLASTPLRDLEILFDVGHLWFAHATVRNAHSNVRLSSVGGVYPAFSQAVPANGGAPVAVPVQPLRDWTSIHRLNCESLGTKGEIVLELAIVEPKPAMEALTSVKLYKSEAPQVEALLVDATFFIGNEQKQLSGELPVEVMGQADLD